MYSESVQSLIDIVNDNKDIVENVLYFDNGRISFISRLIKNIEFIERKERKYCFKCKKVIFLNECFSQYWDNILENTESAFLRNRFDRYMVYILHNLYFKICFFDYYFDFIKLYYNKYVQFYCCDCFRLHREGATKHD